MVDALRGPLRPDGYLFIPIVGGSGTGKSHLVRWVKDQTIDTPNWEIRYLPKNRTGLRQAIEIVIEGLSGPKIDEARAALQEAPANTESDDILAERLLDELAVVIGHAEDTVSDQHSDAERQRVAFRTRLRTRLPNLFHDPVVRRRLIQPGAVIRRLVGLNMRGTEHDDGLGDDARRFASSDLPLTFEEINETSKDARELLNRLAVSADLLSTAVDLINEALPTTEKRVFVTGRVDIIDVFRDVRRALRQSGRELVLFIEDFTVLHGVEREFLDAIVEPTRAADGNTDNDLCNLRIIFAVTEGHFGDLDTVQTRCDDAYWLDAPYGDGGVELDEALSFLGRYLNAARLEPAAIEEAWARHTADDWVPNACTTCSHREACHEAFGVSAEGYGLYPLNAPAAQRMVKALSDRRFDPRDVVRELINRFLLQAHADLQSDAFPSEETLQAFDRNTEPLPPLLATELRSRRPIDHGRVVSTLRYWGGIDDPTQIDPNVFAAFGLADPGLEVVAPAPRPADGATPRSPRPEPETSTTRNVALEDHVSKTWRVAFLELSRWQIGGSQLTAKTTNELRKLVHSAVLANLEFSATPFHKVNTSGRSRFDAETHIYIDGSVTNQRRDAALIELDRTAENAAVLQGLILANDAPRVQFPQADQFRRLVATAIEAWTDGVANRLTGPVPPSAVGAVHGSIVAAVTLGLARRSADPDELLQAIFRSPPEQRSTDSRRTDAWRALATRASTQLDTLRPKLDAEFGESRGGDVRTIQADRILPVIEAFARSWDFESEDPTIAPFLRTVKTAINSEWTLLRRHVDAAQPHIDSRRTWTEQTGKVLEVLEAAHRAGRLADATALEELMTLAGVAPDQVLQSFNEATRKIGTDPAPHEQLALLASDVPAHVTIVEMFVSRATRAFDLVESDLAERQSIHGVSDLEALVAGVLEATARFADLTKEPR